MDNKKLLNVYRILPWDTKSPSDSLLNNESKIQKLKKFLNSPTHENQSHHEIILRSYIHAFVPPQFASRFQPPGPTSGCFYGASKPSTSAFEVAFHLMKEFGSVTTYSTKIYKIIQVQFKSTGIIKVDAQINSKNILDKNDYATAWEFRRNHANAPAISYPSVREPNPDKGLCFAVFDKNKLSENTSQDWDVEIQFNCSEVRFKSIVTPASLPAIVKWATVN